MKRLMLTFVAALGLIFAPVAFADNHCGCGGNSSCDQCNESCGCDSDHDNGNDGSGGNY